MAMKKVKKPDSVVWDEEKNTYIAKLLPFASSLSGPVIEVPNVDAFKQKGVEKASKQFAAELNELQEKMRAFANLASDTQEVYRAHFKFEPIVGTVYHLYEGKDKNFLSLIRPEEWSKKHLGSFRLSADYKWERI